MTITKIVAGGQTGADRGGLDAAIWCKVAHGGWCPKGRRAEDGTVPSKYQLQEAPSKDYLGRTEANVVDSDATVIFSYGDLGGGSLKTAQFARKHNRPWIHIDLACSDRQQAVDAVVEWLKTKCPEKCTLNVAGSRESKAAGIRGVVKARMIDVISKANGQVFYPIADDAEPDEDGARIEDLSPAEQKRIAKIVQQQADLITLHHPKTMEQAVLIVLAELSADNKENIRKSTKEDFAGEQHFGLAMWVRNAMIHRNENRIDLMADFQRGCRDGKWQGNAEPDAVSMVIVQLVWESLQPAEPS